MYITDICMPFRHLGRLYSRGSVGSALQEFVFPYSVKRLHIAEGKDVYRSLKSYGANNKDRRFQDCAALPGAAAQLRDQQGTTRPASRIIDAMFSYYC